MLLRLAVKYCTDAAFFVNGLTIGVYLSSFEIDWLATDRAERIGGQTRSHNSS
jgi:hypothetical protein